jgi:hypothetical protein
MKKVLAGLFLMLVLSLPTFSATPDEEFKQNLGRATLALYHAEQKCAWVKKQIFIFDFNMWECKFEEHFVCTATVIAGDGAGTYLAVTAGHCFDWKEIDKYHLAENTFGKPVMHKVNVLKFENDERYDYGLVTFKSLRGLPIIQVSGMESDPPALGTSVLNVNISYGIIKEFAEGRVVSNVIEGDVDGRCSSCNGRYLVNIGLGPGASGSAIVNMQTHEIVGLAEAIFPETTMPTLVIPMGKRFADFYDDDSAGLKPLPEGPLPKDAGPEQIKHGVFFRIIQAIIKFFTGV